MWKRETEKVDPKKSKFWVYTTVRVNFGISTQPKFTRTVV